jgi:hypothetical protein
MLENLFSLCHNYIFLLVYNLECSITHLLPMLFRYLKESDLLSKNEDLTLYQIFKK